MSHTSIIKIGDEQIELNFHKIDTCKMDEILI